MNRTAKELFQNLLRNPELQGERREIASLDRNHELRFFLPADEKPSAADPSHTTSTPSGELVDTVLASDFARFLFSEQSELQSEVTLQSEQELVELIALEQCGFADEIASIARPDHAQDSQTNLDLLNSHLNEVDDAPESEKLAFCFTEDNFSFVANDWEPS